MQLNEYLPSVYQRGVASNGFRDRMKSALSTLAVPTERRRAMQLEKSSDRLLLHLGCGDTYLDGWVNIDLARPGRQLDLRWDLRRGIPFSTGAVDAVFSEHFLEHLDIASAFRMMVECRRVLRSDGVFRAGVPDIERYIRAYSDGDSIIQEVRAGRPTKALAINEVFYFHGHRSMYDAETLCLMLREAGFATTSQSSFGQGGLVPSPDSPSRRPETLYVEAVA